jgi:protein-S-isoprenylcysteine O-methyltransferase Ste14
MSSRFAHVGAGLAETLARRRVALGFVSGAIVLWLAQPTASTLAAGTAIAALGEALRIWAAGHLNKSREVTSSGPYRWLAHPLYAGSSIMGAGLAIGAGSLAVAVIIGLYLGATITAAMKREEAFLRGRFGGEYDRYRSLARGAPALDASRRGFSLAQAVANREHRAAIGLAVAVLLLLLKATYNGMFWRQPGG